jgi:hypothetical protein
LWTVWEKYKEGIDTRRFGGYDWAVTQFYLWLSVAGVLAVAGGSLIVVGIASKDKQAKPRRAAR